MSNSDKDEGYDTSEQQFQQIPELLRENKKTLKIIQYLVGITLGLLLGVYIGKLF